MQVSWSKDSGSDFPAAKERRISVTSSSSGSSGSSIPADPSAAVNSFVIYGVKAEDMGVYTCTARNPAGAVSWNISLTVLEVPR